MKTLLRILALVVLAVAAQAQQKQVYQHPTTKELLDNLVVPPTREIEVKSGGALTLRDGAQFTLPDATFGIEKVSGLTSALAAKAPVNSPTFTGTVSGITAGMVGLGNVNNTSDVNKPVSTAQAAADAAVLASAEADATSKASTAQATAIATASADATAKASAAQAAAIQRENHTGTQLAETISDFVPVASAAAPVQSVAGKSGAVSLVKADIGLANADNTSDTNKPVSIAQAAADAAVLAAAEADATTKANAAEAVAVQRANHTGTQAMSTVSGLEAALGEKLAAIAYTATATRDQLAGLAGADRLDASAIKNLPAGEVTLAGAEQLSNKELVGFTLTGPVVAAPTTITTSIDVTTPVNEVEIDDSSTVLTFSATPATGTQTLLRVANTDDEPQMITIPSVFSEATNATRTTLTVPAAGSLTVALKREASRWAILGDGANIADLPAGVGQVSPSGTLIETYNVATGRAEKRTVAQLVQPMGAGTVRANTLDVADVPQDVLITSLPAAMFPEGGAAGHVVALTGTSPRTFGLVPNAAGYQTPVSLGSATEIDFSAGTSFTKTLSSNTTFTFANVGGVNGKTVEVMVTNPSTYTADWPSTVRWHNDTEPTQTTGGKADIYRFLVVGSDVIGDRPRFNIPADTTAPLVSSASIDVPGTTLTATFSEGVTVGAGGAGGWALAGLSEGAATLGTPSIAGDNLSATFTISRAIWGSETPTLGYTQPGNGFEDFAGNDLATFSGGSITNNSTTSGYLLAEDWGTQNGWSANPDANVNYAASGVGGQTYALFLAATGSSSTRSTWKAFTEQTFAEGFFIYRMPDSAPSTDANVFRIEDSAGNVLYRLTVRSTRAFRAFEGSGTGTVGTGGNSYTLGTAVYIWWQYVAGSGANSSFMLWTSSTSTKPGSPSSASLSGGGQTAPVGRLRFQTNQNISGTYSKARVSAGAIGSDPL